MLLGNYATHTVPRAAVTLHQAVHGMDYESVADICQAMADDGFPGFLKIDMAPKGTYIRRMGRNSFAYMWSTLKIFREIADKDHPPFGYYNQDDCFFRRDHTIEALLKDVSVLASMGDFLFAQLKWYDGGNKTEKVALGTYPKYNVGIYHTGDSGLILSQAGAQCFIDFFQEKCRWMEGVPLSIAKSVEMKGVYSIADPNQIVCKVNSAYFEAAFHEDRALDDG